VIANASTPACRWWARCPATSSRRAASACDPALLLLMCGALGYRGEQRFNLAAVVEFIHTATLLHDDVVDESDAAARPRHGQRGLWQPGQRAGGRFSVFPRFPDDGGRQDMRIMQVLADATNVIAEGEVLQLMNMHDAALDETGYLR
jgi:octaprenyl-diphosphate synthase